MAYELKDGSGSLFKNQKKESANQPDFTGDAMWKGQKVRLSAWTKQDKNGNNYFSLSLQEPFKPETKNTERKYESKPVQSQLGATYQNDGGRFADD